MKKINVRKLIKGTAITAASVSIGMVSALIIDKGYSFPLPEGNDKGKELTACFVGMAAAFLIIVIDDIIEEVDRGFQKKEALEAAMKLRDEVKAKAEEFNNREIENTKEAE